jgi:uncharacterized protein YndB with AHSA1/START domain
MENHTLSFSQMVKASPEDAYRAFTNSTNLREWLCAVATVDPRPGGRLYLWWLSNYYTCGEFSELKPNEKVSFTWHGRGEPGPTQVQVSFKPQDGGTLVSVEHSGIGMSEDWARVTPEIEKGWKMGLENLASVLETGEDLRFVLRPMLGITIGEYNEERAKKLNVPVKEGIRLDGLVPGMGAEAAGLQSDDVVVKMAGITITHYNNLTNAMQHQRAGDTVEVEFYRGPERKTVQMVLSRRPMPEIPWSASGLAERVSQINAGIAHELREFLEGVTDEEASFKPAPEEWSIKENLAHLIHGERGYQIYTAELLTGHERHYDDYGDNVNAQIEATLAVYPTLNDLLEELKRSSAETVELFARIPDKFISRKGTYWRFAYGAVEEPHHFHSHIDQMRDALEAARSAVKV